MKEHFWEGQSPENWAFILFIAFIIALWLFA